MVYNFKKGSFSNLLDKKKKKSVIYHIKKNIYLTKTNTKKKKTAYDKKLIHRSNCFLDDLTLVKKMESVKSRFY